MAFRGESAGNWGSCLLHLLYIADRMSTSVVSRFYWPRREHSVVLLALEKYSMSRNYIGQVMIIYNGHFFGKLRLRYSML